MQVHETWMAWKNGPSSRREKLGRCEAIVEFIKLGS
jgi:hypothetical protein